MVTTREIKGSKEEIAEQIRGMGGRIISALVLVEELANPKYNELTEEEFAKLVAEMAADTVSVPHADDSREAIYTRMPGE